MAFFHRPVHAADPSFTPLFRLLGDFDNYSRELQGKQGGGHRKQPARTFNPKFDVRETENTYELHAELPGIDRNDVHIEFTEPQTIVIRGRIERTYTSGTPPAGLVDETSHGTVAEAGKKHKSFKPTVEDEAAEATSDSDTADTADTANTADTAAEHSSAEVAQQQPARPAEKYWVSERSIGEFSRNFSFPSRIEQEGVAAHLNNGVLSVTVPKAKKHEARRININVD